MIANPEADAVVSSPPGTSVVPDRATRRRTRTEQARAEAEAVAATQTVMQGILRALQGAPRTHEGQPVSTMLTVADVETIGHALPLLPHDIKCELSALLAHVPPAPPAIPFREFVAKAKPDYRWYDYGDRIHDRLMDVAEGRLQRLMIFAPPRHGKSELVSRLFSAYYQYRFPHRWVGLCSYGDDLAFTLARAARANYLAAGGTLGGIRDETVVKQFGTGHAGGMWAAGAGGPITGKGFHLGIIDDPLKNSEQAKSPVIRTKHKDWWQGTFYTRREPNAAIVIIMTPWHEDDLANWLLRRETVGEGSYPERWHLIALDALRDTREPFYVPATCTLEPDPRPHGAALCPERQSREELLRTQQSVGSYYWSAMFQARPKPQEGNKFKRQWFKPLKAVPANLEAIVRYWDIAGTDKKDAAEHDPDFTRSVLMGKFREQLASDTGETGNYLTRYVILDGSGGQMSPLRRDDHIVVKAREDGAQFGALNVAIWLERDPGGGGEERTAAMLGKLSGFRARAEPPLGASKELRAEPFQAQAEAGNVYYLEGDWNAEFFEELCGFPYAAHDDYVDACSGAFAKLAVTTLDAAALPVVLTYQASAPIAGTLDVGEDPTAALGGQGAMFPGGVGLIG